MKAYTKTNKCGRVILTTLCAMFLLGLLVAPAKAQSITNDLVGHYKLDGNANDSSISLNNAWETNAPVYVTGQMGQALQLDGTTQWAEAPVTPAAVQGGGAKTLSVWFKQSSLANKSVVAFGERIFGRFFEMLLYSGKVICHAWQIDTLAAGSPDYAAGQWNHAVITYDGGSALRIYFNGQLFNEKAAVLDTGSGPLLLGSGLYSYFNGQIDDVGIWARELSLEEVQAIFTAGLQGKDLSQAVAGGPAPLQVTLTAPTNNDSFLPNSEITVSAEVNVPERVSKVEFFAGSKKIGEDTSNPYSIVWSNGPISRSYIIRAKGTETNGVTADSGTAIIVVPFVGPVSSITDGLLGYYRLDQNANDASPQTNNAVEINGPVYVAGQISQGLKVNGAQRAEAEDPGMAGLVPKSLSVWFNHSVPANSVVASVGNLAGAEAYEVLLYGGKIAAHFYGGGYDTLGLAPNYNIGEWYHVVLTVGGTNNNVKLYVNGQLVTDTILPTLHTGSGSLKIGTGSFPGFNGIIDDVGIWYRELTLAEVQSIYTNGLAAKDLFGNQGSPQLQASISGGNIIVAWPEPVTGFNLESAATLVAPSWTQVTNQPVIEDGLNKVSLAIDPGVKFFRLKK